MEGAGGGGMTAVSVVDCTGVGSDCTLVKELTPRTDGPRTIADDADAPPGDVADIAGVMAGILTSTKGALVSSMIEMGAGGGMVGWTGVGGGGKE